MPLYAAGRTTGLVLESGDDASHSLAIYEGFPIPESYLKSEIAGRSLTNYLKNILIDMGEPFKSSTESETVRDIKEKLCYVSNNYDEENNLANSRGNADKEYTLPDNSVIRIPGSVCITVPELLFKPELMLNLYRKTAPELFPFLGINHKTCLGLHTIV